MDEHELKEKCKKLQEYQGHANYETWAVNLWLDNEESLQRMWEERAKEIEKDIHKDRNVKEGIWTPCQAIKFRLADEIKDFVEEQNPLADKASMYSDILSANLSEVDWNEVAEARLPENPCGRKRR
jgi:hypothetical protein